jgi:hypothetical protein
MTLKRDCRCPACSSAVILQVDCVQEHGDLIFPSPLRVLFRGPLDTRGMGSFEVFICKGCGYTEWYARGYEHLEASASEGVRLIDARPTSCGGPYRTVAGAELEQSSAPVRDSE